MFQACADADADADGVGARRVNQTYGYYGLPHQRKCNTQASDSGFGLGGHREREKERKKERKKEKEDSQLDEVYVW